MIGEAERIARIRLFRSETVGPITFYKLLARYGSAAKAIKALPIMAKRAGRASPPRVTTVQQVSDELKMLEAQGGQMIVFGDDQYPQWLTNVEDAPPVLSILGDAAMLSRSCIAIVGSRNASANGKRYTHGLSADLGQKGQVIVSGLARGIDTMAHKAALQTGTIAVLAGGIDRIYPTENTDLYHDIIKHGCIVSEMPMGTAPTAHHFPRRNRIVSGLSKGVVVVEASMKSGSLITARLASEQGREVFAIPGFPGDPRAAGPNALIQNGAKLIQNADDILEEIAAMDTKAIQPQQTMFDGIAEDFTPFDFSETGNVTEEEVNENTHASILQNLTQTPTEVDELVRSCQISIQSLQTVLLDLELAGDILRHPGNKVSRAA